jgi:hypothetical protein
MVEKLPNSNEESKAKLDRGHRYNLKEGLDARYDMWGGDSKKWEKLNDPEYTSAHRLAQLFQVLRAAQNSDETEEESSGEE